MKILAMAGSTREGSYNRKLLKLAVQATEKAGGEVTLLDLRDHELPIYNGDLEERKGLPEAVVQLKKLFGEHTGLLIASPEYNSGYTPLLKNTLDWVSRPAPGEGSLAQFHGKTAMLLAASPSPFGGIRGLLQLQTVLVYMGVTVVPGHTMISGADKAFDQAGEFVEAGNAARLEKQAANFTRLLRAH